MEATEQAVTYSLQSNSNPAQQFSFKEIRIQHANRVLTSM